MQTIKANITCYNFVPEERNSCSVFLWHFRCKKHFLTETMKENKRRVKKGKDEREWKQRAWGQEERQKERRTENRDAVSSCEVVKVTWLESGLMDSSLGRSDGVPRLLQVRLGYTAFALAARGAVGAQVTLGGGFGAAGTAVGLFYGRDLCVCKHTVGVLHQHHLCIFFIWFILYARPTFSRVRKDAVTSALDDGGFGGLLVTRLPSLTSRTSLSSRTPVTSGAALCTRPPGAAWPLRWMSSSMMDTFTLLL